MQLNYLPMLIKSDLFVSVKYSIEGHEYLKTNADKWYLN